MFDKDEVTKDSEEVVENDGTNLELVVRMMRVSITPLDRNELGTSTVKSSYVLNKNNPIFEKERLSSKVNLSSYFLIKLINTLLLKSLFQKQLNIPLGILNILIDFIRLFIISGRALH